VEPHRGHALCFVVDLCEGAGLASSSQLGNLENPPAAFAFDRHIIGAHGFPHFHSRGSSAPAFSIWRRTPAETSLWPAGTVAFFDSSGRPQISWLPWPSRRYTHPILFRCLITSRVFCAFMILV